MRKSNIEREWRRSPPREHIVTLDDLVDDFQWRRQDPSSPLCKNRDDIADWCAEAAHLREAIERAVNSIRPNGKCHNHQSRVPLRVRQRLGRFLIRDITRLRRATSFEAVLAIVEGYGLPGIGPVTAYDVATRVCAYLRLEPRAVHMHAGCLAGARALTGRALKVGEQVGLDELPLALGRLKPDEVEDFLCVYREVLGRVAVLA